METPTNGDAENGTRGNKGPQLDTRDYHLKTFQTSLNLLTHVLIGVVVGSCMIYVFRAGVPIGATPVHIVLCVLGYQLLMAQAILSLSPHNGWSAHLKLVDKKRAHWILQVLGSGLAIAGSFIKILDKTVHWNSLHGQFALVALVFTVVSMVNGLASLYAYEVRKFIPGKLSKLTHICFGIVAFAASCISLCYGIEKNAFSSWSGLPGASTLISFTSIFACLVIVAPFITFVTKIKSN